MHTTSSSSVQKHDDAARAEQEAGMTTAEYAVGTVAACAFAAVLWKVLTSDGVAAMVTDLVGRALTLAP